jgi:hypothetical protein
MKALVCVNVPVFCKTAILSLSLILYCATRTIGMGINDHLSWSMEPRPIKGKVFDSKNAPLAGVTVTIKGLKKNAVTDDAGNYVIEANTGDILVFSYTGFTTQEIKIGNSSSLNVHMVEDDKSLNTVVVVGYGSQSKAKVTGAIATIKMDDVLGDRPVSTVSALLQGTVPGLQSTINSGQPGASTSLNVRGATDLNTSGNSVNAGGPLILVDNVPFKSKK